MKTCLCLTFDKYMKVPAAVSIQSLSDNYSGSESIDVVCVYKSEDSDEILETINKVDAPKFNLIFRELEPSLSSELSKIKHPHWATNTALYRLFMGSILHDYDKVIYFDSDILAVQDIQPILDFKLYGKLVAVPDYGRSIIDKEDPHVVDFNSGFIIADLNWWRDSNIEEKFKEHLTQSDLDIFIDQGVFNLYTKHVYQPAPLTFNFFLFENDENYNNPNWDASWERESYKRAIILHFAGRQKPWNYKDDKSVVGHKWKEIAKRLEK